jgi:hypothetical protein
MEVGDEARRESNYPQTKMAELRERAQKATTIRARLADVSGISFSYLQYTLVL